MSTESNREARIFSAETRFENLARRPGGVPRGQAIERAQAQIDSLRSEFSLWLSRELQELSAVFEHIGNPTDNKSLLEAAYGRCCQLRDVGTTMGFELTSVISKNLCQILDAVIRNRVAYQKETIDCHLEALLLTSKPPYCLLRPDQLPEMTSGLRRVVERAITPLSA